MNLLASAGEFFLSNLLVFLLPFSSSTVLFSSSMYYKPPKKVVYERVSGRMIHMQGALSVSP